MITRLSVLVVLTLGVVARVAASSEDDDRTKVAIEALLRLQTTNLHDNPRLEQAVTNLLSKSRGTANFVKLVTKSHLTNQTEGLLELALREPAGEAGVQAMQFVLLRGDLAPIQRTIRSTNAAEATKMTEALGNTASKDAVALLLPIVTNVNYFAAVRRQSVRSLAQTAEGASAILHFARDNQLPDDLTFTATTELNRVRWPEIKTEAAKVLPLPQAQNAEPLPPLSQLLQIKGDSKAGARVFASPATACANCHRVRGEGVEVGPDLSEIGTKLGKEALYEAILDPSAGISFGYEPWQLTLTSGDEAFGLLVSETADEVALKGANGLVTRYKKADIAKREQMKLSMMPAGLQQAMSIQELADLVEYLTTLRKPGN